jgi:short-subunit dehydrogenase
MGNNKKEQAPVALVTGAAGGIGGATSELLFSKGYRMVLVDINQQALKQVGDKFGADSLSYPVDVTDRNQIKNLMHSVISKTGRLDVLVNNAGMVVTKPFEDCDLDTLIKENDLNYLSAMYCIKEALPYMQQAGTGTVVSIASLGAILPLSVSPGYTASKAALRGLMLSLNMTLKPYGIHAGCVCPTAVDTQMLYYEATSGGSTLNFLQKPLTAQAVAKAVWRVIRDKKMEVCIPWHEGISSKLGGCFPSILPHILPLLEKLGEYNRKKYLQKKQQNI